MAKYLDSTGAARLVNNVKNLLDTKVDAETGKGLSSEDYTTAEKTKLAGLENYTLPIASDTQMGGFKVGAGLSINAETGVLSATGGGVADSVDWNNITSMPEDLVHDEDIANFITAKDLTGYASTADVTALENKLTGVYHFKGSVADMTALLAVVDPEVGDTYNITDTGMNAAWTGTAWDEFGTTVNIESMSNTEVDKLFE